MNTPSLTTSNDFDATYDIFNTIPESFKYRARDCASNDLSREYEEEGYETGISSSDVSHRVMRELAYCASDVEMISYIVEWTVRDN